MTEVSEELLRQILQFLWQQHVMNEQQYLYWIVLAPVIALMFYLVLWIKHRAHCPGLLDTLAFFFAPRGPEKMLIFKDLLGHRFIFYDYSTIKSGSGYLIQAGPYLIKTDEDPESYAEPASLLDARGPSGVPSPFGLWIRQMVASYIILAVIAVSFAQTFWITYSVYIQAMNVAYTSVDLLSFAALVMVLAWFIATLVRTLSPQTLVISLSAIGMTEGYIEASPALDVYSSFPPAKLLKSISREPKIVVPQPIFTYVKEEEKKEKKTFWDRLYEEIRSNQLTASVISMLGQTYIVLVRSLGQLLQDRYDISVAAKARYQLEEVKLPRGFLNRYAGVLALIAIIAIAAIAIL